MRSVVQNEMMMPARRRTLTEQISGLIYVAHETSDVLHDDRRHEGVFQPSHLEEV